MDCAGSISYDASVHLIAKQDTEIPSHLNEILRGNFWTRLNGNLSRGFPRKLEVFLSSTFTDTHSERNVILKKILKDLRALAEPHGIEVSFVDMRYGVRDESTLKHMTWEECKRELKRCHEESAGIFFLSLQGSKYG